MNQHDEQQAAQPGQASPAGTGTTTGDGQADETPSVPPEPQMEMAEQSATEAPSTGDDRVDEALSRLAELDRLDVTEHAGVVQDVHRALQDTLAEEED